MGRPMTDTCKQCKHASPLRCDACPLYDKDWGAEDIAFGDSVPGMPERSVRLVNRAPTLIREAEERKRLR